MTMNENVWENILRTVMTQPPGTVTHMDIEHKSYCMIQDGEECSCNPTAEIRRVN